MNGTIVLIHFSACVSVCLCICVCVCVCGPVRFYVCVCVCVCVQFSGKIQIFFQFFFLFQFHSVFCYDGEFHSHKSSFLSLRYVDPVFRPRMGHLFELLSPKENLISILHDRYWFVFISWVFTIKPQSFARLLVDNSPTQSHLFLYSFQTNLLYSFIYMIDDLSVATEVTFTIQLHIVCLTL